MDVRPLTPDLAVADQLKPQDLTLVKSLGYRSVICNRPDGEAPDQPLFETIATAAELCGIETRYLPVVPAVGVGPDHVKQMKQFLENLPKPILAYCRSGARSTTVANAAMAAGNDR